MLIGERWFLAFHHRTRPALATVIAKLRAMDAAALRPMLRAIGRLAHLSVFDDVAEAFTDLMQELERRGISVPRPSPVISMFVPTTALVPLKTTDPLIRQLFLESFAQTGHVPNLLRVLAWHPTYARAHMNAFEFIMRGEGPLPVPWRIYIALMAASRHRCRYLVSFEELMFLNVGGDEEWLRGLQFVPKKLQDLAWLNAYLAHQPWLITKDRVAQLARGADAWSMTELVQAIVIMTTFHSLASLSFGCGLVCDDETAQDAPPLMASPPPDARSDQREIEQATNQLLDKLRASETDDSVASAPECDRREAFVRAGLDGEVGTTQDIPQFDLFDRYCGDIPLVYEDFDMRSTVYRMFRLQEYCWSDHGFDLVGRFYNGAAQLLEEEFTVAFTMTDNQLNENKDVDTAKFRSAIWYYTQRVYGMSNDDYDYGEVNYLVSRELKAYVKKVTCYPERVTAQDFHHMGLALRPEERCHINVLALEARKQAALLYGLHAVMLFMSAR